MADKKSRSRSVTPGAKGDLVVGSGATSSAIVTVGTDGQVLTADSTTASGTKWATPASGSITWTGRKAPASGGVLNDFVYNGSNLYVAVGSGGNLFSSPDAITWTSRTSGFGVNDINSVAYGNGVFVAVGSNGTITTSTDGITWTARTAGVSTNTLWRVRYINSLFIAVGAGANGGTGGITTSTDGTTWTKRTTPTTSGSNLYDVNYGNGYYVTVGSASTKNGYYSTDGATWTVLGTGAATDAAAVFYSNGTWYMTGLSGSTTSTKYITGAPTGTWSNTTYGNIAVFHGSTIGAGTGHYGIANGFIYYRDYSNTAYIYKNSLTATTPSVGFDAFYPPILVPSQQGDQSTAAYVSPYAQIRALYVKSDGGLMIADNAGRIYTSF